MNSGKFRARITKDGILNTLRVGGKPHSLSEIYHWLVTMSWVRFFSLITCTYFIISLVFALAYFGLDFENIRGIDARVGLRSFSQLFLFSAQTLSTVGGIGVTPEGIIGSLLFTAEAMVSLLCMTLMTGLLYSRFSNQSIRLIFGEKALISPFKNGRAMMVRLANERERVSAFVDMEAEMHFVWYDDVRSNNRRVELLSLEVKKIAFMPIAWTLVHPIDEHSPFVKYDLNKIDFEIAVKIRGIDSITGQTIFSGHGYRKNDFVWNARFTACSEVNEEGVTIVYLDKIGSYEDLDPINEIPRMQGHDDHKGSTKTTR